MLTGMGPPATDRALTCRQAARQVWPFALASAAAFASLASRDGHHLPYLLAGLAAVVVIAVFTLDCLRGRRLRLAVVAPALAFFPVVGVLRDVGGGAASGVDALVLLPVFWVALYGRTVDLALSVVGVAATFLVPVVLIGGPQYPSSELRAALIWLIASSVVGSTVQQLVTTIRDHAAAQEAVAVVARELSAADDVRASVCAAALALTGGDYAALFERDAGGEFAVTAFAGDDEARGPVSADTSGVDEAASSRRPVYTAATGSLLHEPLLQGDDAVGVVAVGWAAPRRLAAKVSNISALFAHEAVVAIERADLVAQLDRLARSDGLTGLPNRRSWDAELAAAVDHARANGTALAVALLDLDRFKAYNDSRGHAAGDRLLREAAAAWSSQLRATDVLARYGGEEFGVILLGLPPVATLAVCERLRGAVPGGQTCSIGLAVWDGHELDAELAARADAALYEAKAAGRNRLVLAPVITARSAAQI
jgi:diguanylate cyclase (GGDEF)-like protein